MFAFIEYWDQKLVGQLLVIVMQLVDAVLHVCLAHLKVFLV